MAAITTNSIFISIPAASNVCTHTNRRRRISPSAGRALEILGHAIEYLTDEFVDCGGSISANISANNEQIKAVQLLMELNRQVYFECPEIPSLGERFRALMGIRTS